MPSKSTYYDPSTEDIRRVIDETLETAADGVDPMFPIEDLGQCYIVEIGGGHDTDMHPWTFGMGRFFLEDREGRMHWMHPDIRAALDKITPEVLLEAIKKEHRPGSDKTPEELAPLFHQWCQENLAKLDARMEHASPFHEAAAQIRRYPSPEHAHQAFKDLCKQHQVSIDLGRNLARRALRLDICSYVSMIQPTAKAALLSRMIDTQLCPAPPINEARRALARLYIAEGVNDPEQVDIDCVAIATAHGQFSENLPAQRHQTSGALTLLTYQIEAGQFDPEFDGNRPYPRLHTQIGQMLLGHGPSLEPLSAHQALLLIGAANARQRLIGQPPVTPELCREAARAENEIPF